MPEIKFIVRPFEDGWIAETIIDGYEIGFTAKTPLLALDGLAWEITLSRLTGNGWHLREKLKLKKV